MGCTKEKLGKYFCSGLFLKENKVGFEKVAAHHPSTCTSKDPEWTCWRNHIVEKIGGNWWSFFNESYCDPTSKGGPCAWQVNEVASVINNTCLQDAVYTAIEAYPPSKSCFDSCQKPFLRSRNTSDPCWIGCTYDAVLGPVGGQSNGTISGMNLTVLVDAWEAAFDTDGCPQVEEAW
jgi:hypothetical protein